MKRTKFNSLWLKEVEFEKWLMEDSSSNLSFRCSLCGTTLFLGTMGRGALIRHKKSAKHKKLEASQTSKSANMLLSWANSVPSGTISEDNTSQSENAATNLNDLQSLNAESSSGNIVPAVQNGSTSVTVENWAISDQILKAEVLWSLQTTVNHYSHRSK